MAPCYVFVRRLDDKIAPIVNGSQTVSSVHSFYLMHIVYLVQLVAYVRCICFFFLQQVKVRNCGWVHLKLSGS